MASSDTPKDKSTSSEEKDEKVPKTPKSKTKIVNTKDGAKKYNTGRWSAEEHKRFMKAIELYGKDWKKVQQYVGTRTSAQSRSHAQKVLPKSEFETTNQVACTPQKKLKPLEANFGQLECMSNDGETDEKHKKIIEYAPPPPQMAPSTDLSKVDNLPSLQCSRKLSHAVPLNPHKRK